MRIHTSTRLLQWISTCGGFQRSQYNGDIESIQPYGITTSTTCNKGNSDDFNCKSDALRGFRNYFKMVAQQEVQFIKDHKLNFAFVYVLPLLCEMNSKYKFLMIFL